MLHVDRTRLLGDLAQLGAIGRSVEGGSLDRRAFSDAEEQARQWLLERAREAGLEAREDGARNVRVRLSPRTAGAQPRDEAGPTVLTGSHLDTVPQGGALDGALGVVAGLECLRRLRERELDRELSQPIELCAFTDEEGRFGSMLGSRAFSGELDATAIAASCDERGRTLETALAERGGSVAAMLQARCDPELVRCYVELHIEQGPELWRAGGGVGAVERIIGLFRWRGRIIGAANHAGTTPMATRRDALMGFVEFARDLEPIVARHGSPAGRATVGRLEVLPGATNVIPGEVRFSLEVRDATEARLEQLEGALRQRLDAVIARRQLELELDDQIGRLSPVPCDTALVDCIVQSADRLGVPCHRMVSGAAHDAQSVAAIAPVAMIFVPSVDGVSHSSREHTDDDDVVAGADVLLHTLMALAMQK